jgi:phage terminase large subunit-like protein
MAGCSRLALVGATAADVRDIMVEGESGILAISPKHDRPEYQPGLRRLTWPNGAMATCYSADEPDRLAFVREGSTSVSALRLFPASAGAVSAAR